MAIKFKKIYFSSLANIGRSFINPVLIMLVSYFFIHTGAKQELLVINKITVVINAFMVFCSWGLKDYLLKENLKAVNTFDEIWNQALYSKLPLFIISFIIALFLPPDYILIVCGFILFKSINLLYESLIIYHKKVVLFFCLDLIVCIIILGMTWLKLLTEHKMYFYMLLLSEVLKLCLALFHFKIIKPVYFNIKNVFNFFNATKLFFLLSLVSFFQSKADLYILGFLFEPHYLNEYQVKISLISFVQVTITAFVSVYSRLFFKDIFSSELIFTNIVVKCGILLSLLSAPVIFFIEHQFFAFEINIFNNLIIVGNIFIFSLVLIEMYYSTKLNTIGNVIFMVLICGVINSIMCFLSINKLGITGALLSNTASSLMLYILLRFKRKKGYGKFGQGFKI